MDKVPTLLLVATISAGVGAGLMWMITHGPGSPTKNIIDLGGNERPAKRVGFPEPFESPVPATGTADETKRLDPAKPGPLTNPSLVSNTTAGRGGMDTGRNVQIERPATVPGSLSVSLPSQSVSGSAPNLDSSLVSGLATGVREGINDALAFALEAAAPYAKEGYVVREEYWGGNLKESGKAIQHQLFRGNEYWFWVGSETTRAQISVHVYDSKGNLAESQVWQRGNVAAAHVVPANSGTYYIIVSDKFRESKGAAARPTVQWAMAYGFR